MRQTRHLFRAVALGAFLTLLALPVGVRAEISDSDLAERVVDAILRYPQFSIFDDVNIQVDNRNVTLVGAVTAPIKKEEIGKRVGKIDGVRSLTNEIKVLPLSPYDAELRLKIARAIYNHPTFWQYASMANMPIHIVVEGGHVTLTGAVGTQLEKSLAYALAQVPGAFSVRNDLRVDRK
jgi:osmotically-inducible protein OsmY